MDVRALPIAVADVKPHALARDAGDRAVDHGDMQLDRLDELRVRLVAVEHGAVHGEIGRVDLQDETGLIDRQIFVPHLAGDGREIGLVRRVVRVEHGRGDDSGRGRSHERLGERFVFAGDTLEARDLTLDR